jgi:hypothetical protein
MQQCEKAVSNTLSHGRTLTAPTGPHILLNFVVIPSAKLPAVNCANWHPVRTARKVVGSDYSANRPGPDVPAPAEKNDNH